MKSKEKLVIGKTRIDPGQVLDLRLKISETYTGDPIAIPLRVVRAAKAGPTLFICAAVHGNELSGTGVVHELMFQKTLQLTKGTVILIPVVNVFGFRNQSAQPSRSKGSESLLSGKPQGKPGRPDRSNFHARDHPQM